MKKPSNDTKANPGKITYVITEKPPGGRFVLKAKLVKTGDVVDLSALDTKTSSFQRWLRNGWVRQATADDIQAAAQAPIPQTVSAELSASPVPVAAQQIATAQVAPSPTNPRKDFDPAKMAGLVESVKKLGVMQPILVMPLKYVALQPRATEAKWIVAAETGGGRAAGGETRYDNRATVLPSRQAAEDLAREKNAGRGGAPLFELVAGERRWRAATAAKLPTIPAIVRDLSAIEAAELQAVENLQREDLTPLEEAAQYRSLLRLPGYGMARLLEKLGKSESLVYGKLKLLELPEEASKALARGILPQSTAELIARCDDAIRKKFSQGVLHPPRYHVEDGEQVLSFRLAKQLLGQLEQGEERRKRWDEAVKKGQKDGLSIVAEADLSRFASHNGEPGYGAPYVGLQEKCYDHPQRHTWGKILGKSVGELRRFLGRDHEGNGHVWVAREAAVAKAKELGVKIGARSSSSSSVSDAAARALQAAERKRRQAQHDRENAGLTEIVAAVERVGAARLPAEFWRELAATVAADCWSDTSKRASTRRGNGVKGRSNETLAKQAREMEGTKALGLLMELVVIGMRGSGYYGESLFKAIERMRVILGLAARKAAGATADVCTAAASIPSAKELEEARI